MNKIVNFENNIESYDGSEEQLSLFLSLDGYEGPIDLLLSLAREQKVDLSSLSILELSNQYILFIENVRSLNLEVAADYLVMAAWLVFLKSKLLLPELEVDLDNEDIIEISDLLKLKLIRLEAMQKAGIDLMSLPKLGIHRFERGVEKQTEDNVKYNYETSLFELLKVYGQIKNSNSNNELTIHTSNLYSVSDAIERLTHKLKSFSEWVELKDLLPIITNDILNNNSAKASHFLASLELANLGDIKIRQQSTFGTLWMKSIVNRQYKNQKN